MNEYEYVGRIDNWMDTRDLLIDSLKNCDTRLKFNRFLSAIIISIGVSPEEMQEKRKVMGMKEYSKEEMKKVKKMFKESKK